MAYDPVNDARGGLARSRAMTDATLADNARSRPQYQRAGHDENLLSRTPLWDEQAAAIAKQLARHHGYDPETVIHGGEPYRVRDGYIAPTTPGRPLWTTYYDDVMFVLKEARLRDARAL